MLGIDIGKNALNVVDLDRRGVIVGLRRGGGAIGSDRLVGCNA